MSTAQHKLVYTLTSVSFILILFCPFLFGMILETEEVDSGEKRTLTEMPSLKSDSLNHITNQFETYYNEHFAFRDKLIELDSKFKYYIFKSSPVPDKVAIGKENWLFLTGRFYEIDQDITRENRYTAQGLKAQVDLWESRQKELANMHIAYYKAVWPDKHYIYSEYLPVGMKLAQSKLSSRCDQAIAYLKNTGSPIHFIDARNELLQQKSKQQVYYKNDSHWNSAGAFIGYMMLIKHLKHDFTGIKTLNANDFTIEMKEKRGGDLSNLIKIDQTEPEPVYTLKKDTGKIEAASSEGYPAKTEIYKNKNAPNKLRLLIYRDSFTTGMIPFLKQSFSEVYLLWDTPYTLDMVKTVKPDIVIEAYATRYFR